MRNTKTSNVENWNNEERETSSHCRMKVQKYLIGNINEFEIKDKNQNNREWWNVSGLFTDPTIFWEGWGIIFLSHCMYVGWY
jgi:hypothetical protein